MPNGVSQTYERKYCDGGSRKPLRVDMHDLSYEISLVDFEQKNIKTGRRRAIRRRDDEEMKADEAQFIELRCPLNTTPSRPGPDHAISARTEMNNRSVDAVCYESLGLATCYSGSAAPSCVCH